MEEGRSCIVFTADARENAALIAVHEIGHLLGLSFYAPQGPDVPINDHGHDLGPFPRGADGLMRPGAGHDHPGLWLGHSDWERANNNAK